MAERDLKRAVPGANDVEADSKYPHPPGRHPYAGTQDGLARIGASYAGSPSPMGAGAQGAGPQMPYAGSLEGAFGSPAGTQDAKVQQLIAEARAAGGDSLDGKVRGELEQTLGADLGGVRVHTSSAADAAARAVNARAFVLGQDMFFASGTYAPTTPEGKALIQHEAVHTIQQRGATLGDGPLAISTPGDSHEQEAAQVGAANGARPAGASITPVQQGSVSRMAIARSPADAPAPAAPIDPLSGQPFEILPNAPVQLVGRTTYDVPTATNMMGLGTGYYWAKWTFVHDPAGPAPADGERRVEIETVSYTDFEWTVEGKHRVICELEWKRGYPDPDPVPANHRLELAVEVRSLESMSAERFDSVATGDQAYAEARLPDMVDSEMAARGQLTESEDDAAAREERLAAQRENSDKIEAGKQVIARAQLTLRSDLRTIPLAIALGPATGHPGQITLIDFTLQQRRMDYGLASSSQEAVANLESRNSYPAGLVEIVVPENEHGVAPLRTRFETDGASMLAEWASWLTGAGAVATVAGVAAGLLSAPISVPLLIIGGVVGAAGGAFTLAEQLQDAQRDERGIAITALGIASNLVGGGLAGAAGRVVVGGRTMMTVTITQGIALAADTAAFALIAVESAGKLEEIWNDASLSENEKLEKIAMIVADLAINGGVVIAGSVDLARSVHGTPPPGAADAVTPGAADDAARAASDLADGPAIPGPQEQGVIAMHPEQPAPAGAASAGPAGAPAAAGDVEVLGVGTNGTIPIMERVPPNTPLYRVQETGLALAPHGNSTFFEPSQYGLSGLPSDYETLYLCSDRVALEELRRKQGYFDNEGVATHETTFGAMLETAGPGSVIVQDYKFNMTVLGRETGGYVLVRRKEGPVQITPRERTADEIAADAAERERLAGVADAARARETMDQTRTHVEELRTEARAVVSELYDKGLEDLADQLSDAVAPIRFRGRELRLLTREELDAALSELASLEGTAALRAAAAQAPDLAARLNALADALDAL